MPNKRWYFDLVRVAQQDYFHGCGIAAVATACGVSYPRARSEFFPRRTKFTDSAKMHVTQDQQLAVIRRLGFAAEFRDSFRLTSTPMLLSFVWSPGYEDAGCHCVVWDPVQDRIIDPGLDHDRGNDKRFYLNLWKRSGYRSIVITGRNA